MFDITIKLDKNKFLTVFFYWSRVALTLLTVGSHPTRVLQRVTSIKPNLFFTSTEHKWVVVCILAARLEESLYTRIGNTVVLSMRWPPQTNKLWNCYCYQTTRDFSWAEIPIGLWSHISLLLHLMQISITFLKHTF